MTVQARKVSATRQTRITNRFSSTCTPFSRPLWAPSHPSLPSLFSPLIPLSPLPSLPSLFYPLIPLSPLPSFRSLPSPLSLLSLLSTSHLCCRPPPLTNSASLIIPSFGISPGKVLQSRKLYFPGLCSARWAAIVRPRPLCCDDEICWLASRLIFDAVNLKYNKINTQPR
jgi:fermentation-respiration switch protein FrsA (DUF1100 family)